MAGNIGVPLEVETEAGALLAKLRRAGWLPSGAHYDAKTFGNWYVDLQRGDVAIRLVKDRSQYLIFGPEEQLKPAGLVRAFNDLEEFKVAVLNWAGEIKSRGAAWSSSRPTHSEKYGLSEQGAPVLHLAIMPFHKT